MVLSVSTLRAPVTQAEHRELLRSACQFTIEALQEGEAKAGCRLEHQLLQAVDSDTYYRYLLTRLEDHVTIGRTLRELRERKAAMPAADYKYPNGEGGTYVLLFSGRDGQHYYVGQSNNVRQRLGQHQSFSQAGSAPNYVIPQGIEERRQLRLAKVDAKNVYLELESALTNQIKSATVSAALDLLRLCCHDDVAESTRRLDEKMRIRYYGGARRPDHRRLLRGVTEFTVEATPDGAVDDDASTLERTLLESMGIGVPMCTSGADSTSMCYTDAVCQSWPTGQLAVRLTRNCFPRDKMGRASCSLQVDYVAVSSNLPRRRAQHDGYRKKGGFPRYEVPSDIVASKQLRLTTVSASLARRKLIEALSKSADNSKRSTAITDLNNSSLDRLAETVRRLDEKVLIRYNGGARQDGMSNIALEIFSRFDASTSRSLNIVDDERSCGVHDHQQLLRSAVGFVVQALLDDESKGERTVESSLLEGLGTQDIHRYLCTRIDEHVFHGRTLSELAEAPARYQTDPKSLAQGEGGTYVLLFTSTFGECY
ncbi:unnamed protein product [Parajaminaea phylloscopi]